MCVHCTLSVLRNAIKASPKSSIFFVVSFFLGWTIALSCSQWKIHRVDSLLIILIKMKSSKAMEILEHGKWNIETFPQCYTTLFSWGVMNFSNPSTEAATPKKRNVKSELNKCWSRFLKFQAWNVDTNRLERLSVCWCRSLVIPTVSSVLLHVAAAAAAAQAVRLHFMCLSCNNG